MQTLRHALLVALALVPLACGKKEAPAADASAGAIAAAPPVDAPPPPPDAAPVKQELRWTYELELRGDQEGAPPRKKTLVLLETGRKASFGHPAIQLAVLLDGRPLSEEDYREMFEMAPFTVFAPTLSLLVGRYDKQPAIWLFFGPIDKLDAGDVKEALGQPPTWSLSPSTRKARPADPEGDVTFFYGKKVGAWDSACSGYEHPSPESGDYFSWERCFDPAAGMTLLEFDSVWGSYELELKSAPTGFALP